MTELSIQVLIKKIITQFIDEQNIAKMVNYL